MQKKEKIYDEEGLVIRTNKEAEKRKREAVKNFVKALLKLPSAKYADLPIDDTLRLALEEGKRLTNNAFQRHLSYLTRLVYEQDFPTIQATYERIHHPYRNDPGKIHQTEQYRDRLIDGDKTVIDELLKQFADVDIQQLRQLARNAKKEIQQEQQRLTKQAESNGQIFDGDIKPTKSSKLLYQYLFKLELLCTN